MNMASAHSWIECIDTNRSIVYDLASQYLYAGQSHAGMCQGYPYNYQGRGGNFQDEEALIRILKDEYMKPNTVVCKPEHVTYTGVGYGKRMSVSVGKTVYFSYLPNGHVVVDQAARGTLYGLYWTGQPGTHLQCTSNLTDDKLIDHHHHNFDDGNCGQTFTDPQKKIRSDRAGDQYPCIGSFIMPKGTSPGIYSLVWMWKFWDEKNDREIGGKYGGASYSSCFDIEVVDSTNTTDTLKNVIVLNQTNNTDTIEIKRQTTRSKLAPKLVVPSFRVSSGTIH